MKTVKKNNFVDCFTSRISPVSKIPASQMKKLAGGGVGLSRLPTENQATVEGQPDELFETKFPRTRTIGGD